jgi:hypothetical protein
MQQHLHVEQHLHLDQHLPIVSLGLGHGAASCYTARMRAAACAACAYTSSTPSVVTQTGRLVHSLGTKT